MARRPTGRLAVRLAWATALVLLSATSGTARAQGGEWLEVPYGELVDRRQLSHSGESVGVLLAKLDGRPLPPLGERPADRLTHSLLDPLLEPYAFVLPDVLDQLGPIPDPPMVEVGRLWAPGEAQPAWVELLRARRLVVESDGQGRLRMCLPAEVSARGGPSEAAGREALERHWPVVRHVLAAELRRRSSGGAAAGTLQIAVHPYVHAPERTTFWIGRRAYRSEVRDTRSRGRRPPFDLDAVRQSLAAGLQLEGGRLEPDGSLRLLGSRGRRPPTLRGRPLELSDFAVVYRAVFHGGLAEPYMSLDRGPSPQTSIVNYGGRLRDTALGLVSLLCDIRFKTFSQGLDIVSGEDVRARVRQGIPGFRTHLERFSADPASAGVTGQQTRLWFYPDRVDLTLSSELDVLAMRRVRMSAASERVQDETLTAVAGEDPPWTQATVAAINADYDALAGYFPELADLDQVVRLLSLFTWLREARATGLPVPDLDVLLAVELPPVPTPRTFPQLLAFNVLPPAGDERPVQVYDRVAFGEALERLAPPSGRELPARDRLERARAALDPEDPAQARLLEELASVDLATLEESLLDLLTYRAERLRMHRFVLSTLEPELLGELAERERSGERLRVFSLGIGGLDLGMQQALERSRGRRLGLVSSAEPAAAASPPGSAREATDPEPREAWRADPAGLPVSSLPPHGAREDGAEWSRFGDHRIGRRVRQGEPSWIWTRMLESSDEPSSRKLVLDAGGRVRRFERVEGPRRWHYGFEGEGDVARARRLVEPAAEPAPETAEPVPPGLARVTVGAAAGTSADPATPIPVRLEFSDGSAQRRLEADFPRSLLQRLLLGRVLDRSPGDPMPLSPLPGSLGELDAVLWMMGAAERAEPWDPASRPVPGEEHPTRLARALNDWAAAGSDPAVQPAVVGTDPARSAGRWLSAPRLGGPVLLLLPSDGFPGRAGEQLLETLRAAWTAGPVVGELPTQDALPTLVVVAADEAPARFAARLARLAEEPALRGKLLAAWPLGGSLRADLPARLLESEAGPAAIGLGPSSVVSRRKALSQLVGWGQAAAGPLAAGQRVESAAGPILWFF